MSGLKDSSTGADSNVPSHPLFSFLLGLEPEEDPGIITPPLPLLPPLPPLVDKAAQVKASDKILRQNRGVLKRSLLGGSVGSPNSVTKPTLLGQ